MMTMPGIGFDYGCEAMMNLKSQNSRMLRLTSSRLCASLALLAATAAPALSFSQGTAEQRVACTPHVLRLCRAFIPDADKITACLRERSSELSDACRTAIEADTNQFPDGTGARERTAR
ncbi:MAG: hypothetical protein QOJ86_5125 [Bradyrhizobium sp.]|jgi:hypothetical protein|nr:hypothetical protein [Bradyrhizobium sp.]